MPRTTKAKPAVAKKTSKVATKSVEKTTATPTKLQFKFDKKKAIKAGIYTVLFVLSFALIDLFVQYLNNGYSVAVVNGQRVSMSEYYDRLSKAYGVQATAALVDEVLIEQESASKDVSVTQKEVDDRLMEIEVQLGGAEVLEETLKANNISRSDIERQIKLEIMTKKVLEPTITYTDEEVKGFFEQYKGVLYQDEDVKYEDKKDEVKESFLGQKVEEAKTVWLEELRTKAKVQNNITAKPKYGAFKTIANIISNLVKETDSK